MAFSEYFPVDKLHTDLKCQLYFHIARIISQKYPPFENNRILRYKYKHPELRAWLRYGFTADKDHPWPEPNV